MHIKNIRPQLIVALVAIAVGPALVAGAAADPTQPVDLCGSVVAYTAASGSGMPMLTVDDGIFGSVDVALGPVWFLQESGFSAQVGEQVSARVYPCDVCAAPYVAAWVDNTTNGTSVELRDDTATPLWINQGQGGSGSGSGHSGNRDGNGGSGGSDNGGSGGSSNGEPGGSGQGVAGGSGGLDMAQVQTLTGEVEEFSGAAGVGQAIMSLSAEGTIFEIVVSPYQPLQAAGLLIEPGLVLTVTFAPAVCDGEVQLITIALVDDATGVTIQLRDPETGFPISLGGNHNRPHWN